jgi:DNA-directed RNA polymerase specialized sigma24 family protein
VTTYARPIPTSSALDALAESWQRSPSRQVVAELWRGLQYVVSALVKRRRYLLDEDDLRGVAAVALMCALRTWAPGRGYAFKGWAAINMRSQMNAAIDRLRHARLVRDAVAVVAHEPSPDALDRLVQTERETLVANALRELKSELTPAQWHVVEGRLVRGLTYAQLGAEAGKTPQALALRGAKALPYVSERLRALGCV